MGSVNRQAPLDISTSSATPVRFTSPPMIQSDITAFFNKVTVVHGGVINRQSVAISSASSSTQRMVHPTPASVSVHLPPIQTKAIKFSGDIKPYLGVMPPIGSFSVLHGPKLPQIQEKEKVPLDGTTKIIGTPAQIIQETHKEGPSDMEKLEDVRQVQEKEILEVRPYITEEEIKTRILASRHCKIANAIKDGMGKLVLLLRQFIRYYPLHAFDVGLETHTPQALGNTFVGVERIGYPLYHTSQLLQYLDNKTTEFERNGNVYDPCEPPHHWLLSIRKEMFAIASYLVSGYGQLHGQTNPLYVKMYSNYPEPVPVAYGSEEGTMFSITAISLPKLTSFIEPPPLSMIPIEELMETMYALHKREEEERDAIPRLTVNLIPSTISWGEQLVSGLSYQFSRVEDVFVRNVCAEYQPNKIQEILSVIREVAVIIESGLKGLYYEKKEGGQTKALPEKTIHLIGPVDYIKDQFSRASRAQFIGQK